MKKSFTLIELIVVLVICSTILLSGCEKIPPESIPQGYTIEYRESGICILTAYTQDKVGGLYIGYGLCLTKGLEEIKRDYDIEQVVPLIYFAGESSVTKRLMVFTKPK